MSNVSLLMQNNASRYSTPQSPEVASMATKPNSDQKLRGEGFKKTINNVENQLAHETFVIPKSYKLGLDAACKLGA